jgi:hypothetical protein
MMFLFMLDLIDLAGDEFQEALMEISTVCLMLVGYWIG